MFPVSVTASLAFLVLHGVQHAWTSDAESDAEILQPVLERRGIITHR